jgi:hypothetical protein
MSAANIDSAPKTPAMPIIDTSFRFTPSPAIFLAPFDRALHTGYGCES